jgi:hypothetical protein
MPHGQVCSRSSFRFVTCVAAALCIALGFFTAALVRAAIRRVPADGQVIIVLPPRLVAGQPATLAVFGADGKLAPDVDVELHAVPRDVSLNVRTNSTGRVSFVAPAAGNAVIANSEGASAAALLDPPAPAAASGNAAAPLRLAPVVSLRDAFPICGGGFRGDANENHVKINVEVSLILAASPECLVVIAPSNMPPGPATISVETEANRFSGTTTLVSLAFSPPEPPLVPGKQSLLELHVEGSAERLRVAVSNPSPDVLHFLRGDFQELFTSGGARNSTNIRATALRSGDYSFRVRLLPAPDAAAAARFLEIAAPLAAKNQGAALTHLAARLAHHPRDAQKVRAQLHTQLEIIAAGPGARDLRNLLDSADRLLE